MKNHLVLQLKAHQFHGVVMKSGAQKRGFLGSSDCEKF